MRHRAYPRRSHGSQSAMHLVGRFLVRRAGLIALCGLTASLIWLYASQSTIAIQNHAPALADNKLMLDVLSEDLLTQRYGLRRDNLGAWSASNGMSRYHDAIVGEMDVHQVHAKGWLHRLVWTYLFDNKGRLLLLQRDQGPCSGAFLPLSKHPLVKERPLRTLRRALREDLDITLEEDHTLHPLGSQWLRYEQGSGSLVIENVFIELYAVDIGPAAARKALAAMSSDHLGARWLSVASWVDMMQVDPDAFCSSQLRAAVLAGLHALCSHESDLKALIGPASCTQVHAEHAAQQPTTTPVEPSEEPSLPAPKPMDPTETPPPPDPTGDPVVEASAAAAKARGTVAATSTAGKPPLHEEQGGEQVDATTTEAPPPGDGPEDLSPSPGNGGAPKWSPAWNTQGMPTRWGDSLSPDAVHAEYPRPSLMRKEWQSLNGLWDCVLVSSAAPPPQSRPPEPSVWLQGRQAIMVPFPLGSALSGPLHATKLAADEALWYRRAWHLPVAWEGGGGLVVHFEAVRGDVQVWLNGQWLSRRDHSLDSFHLDVDLSRIEVPASRAMELIVCVRRPPSGGYGTFDAGVPMGDGIWQSVWLEPVRLSYPRVHWLESVSQSCADGVVRVAARLLPPISSQGDHVGHNVTLVVDVLVPAAAESTHVAQAAVVTSSAVWAAAGDVAHVTVALPQEHVRLWSPRDPFLYDVHVRVEVNDTVVDEAASYLGLRCLGLEAATDSEPPSSILLNGQRHFVWAVVDHGSWPDGLQTPPSDAAVRHELSTVKSMGFSTIRKLAKVEMSRWYHYCDRMGLLVWQSLPQLDTAESVRSLVGKLGMHPSIIVWDLSGTGIRRGGAKAGTLLMDCLCGHGQEGLVNPPYLCARRPGEMGASHLVVHWSIPSPRLPKAGGNVANGAIGVAAFGAVGGPAVSAPRWSDVAPQGGVRRDTLKGSVVVESAEALWERIEGYTLELFPLMRRGLCAAAWYQWSDVGNDWTGLLPYDRSKAKVSAEKMLALAHRLEEHHMHRSQSQEAPDELERKAELKAAVRAAVLQQEATDETADDKDAAIVQEFLQEEAVAVVEEELQHSEK